MIRISSRVLAEGKASGRIIRLDEPVSFWGGYDPVTGRIIDHSHPQSGIDLQGAIILLPETRGSAGTPGGIAEAVRLGTAPAAIVVLRPDVNLVVGAMVATELYGVHCPVVCVDKDDYAGLCSQAFASISEDGTIMAEDPAATVPASKPEE